MLNREPRMVVYIRESIDDRVLDVLLAAGRPKSTPYHVLMNQPPKSAKRGK